MKLKRRKELAPDRLAVLERIARYESEGGDAFFRDVEEDPPYRTLLPEDVDYLHKTARFRFNGALARAFEAVCGPVVCRQFGLKIKGAENLERLQGGAVFTANHFFAFENQAVRRAALLAPGRHRFYKIIREGNFFFPGFVGWCMKYTDTLPLSSSLKTSALLGRAVGEILSRGDFILIYPEQAMWWNYDKPRPLRPGAYYYAASNSVPVVPTFTTLSPKRKGREMLPDNVAWTLHVGKPIFPDPGLSVRENAARMMNANLEFNRSVYAAEHGAESGETGPSGEPQTPSKIHA